MAAAALAVLLGSGGGWARIVFTDQVGVWVTLRHAEEHVGEAVVVPLLTVQASEPDALRVRKGSHWSGWVYGDSGEARPGDTVSLGLEVAEGGELHIDWVERYPLRWPKVALATGALVLSLGMLPLGFRWREGSVVLRG